MNMNAQFCHPFSVGFDRMFDMMEQTRRQATKVQNYPPYNIVKTSDFEYEIEMAIAGFKIEQLDITLEDGELRVSGNVPEQEVEQTFIHRGLASRPFTRTFTLADSVQVVEAQLEDGILRIRLENVLPDHKKPRKIEIGTTRPSQKELLLEEEN